MIMLYFLNLLTLLLNIDITLFGDNNKKIKYNLDNKFKDDFEKNSVNNFLLTDHPSYSNPDMPENTFIVTPCA